MTSTARQSRRSSSCWTPGYRGSAIDSSSRDRGSVRTSTSMSTANAEISRPKWGLRRPSTSSRRYRAAERLGACRVRRARGAAAQPGGASRRLRDRMTGEIHGTARGDALRGSSPVVSHRRRARLRFRWRHAADSHPGHCAVAATPAAPMPFAHPSRLAVVHPGDRPDIALELRPSDAEDDTSEREPGPRGATHPFVGAPNGQRKTGDLERESMGWSGRGPAASQHRSRRAMVLP